MRLYSVRFSVLVCSLFLFFMGGISFAKPGDYLVYPLDPNKDSSLRCCCCGRAFPGAWNDSSGLCFLKYENGGDVEKVFEEAKKFNLNEAEGLKSKLFEDIRFGNYCYVVKNLKKTLKNMRGLFCSHCMDAAFKVAGIFELKEFLHSGVKPRTWCYNFLSNCHVCNKKLDLDKHVSFCCAKCNVYSYCNANCYFMDKDKDSCPVCCQKLKDGNRKAIRRIPYLFDMDLQKTNDDGTKVKVDMSCGLCSLTSYILDHKGMKFIMHHCFVNDEVQFIRGFELSNEEKEGYYNIPEVDSKFHFVCSLIAPDNYTGDIYKEFNFMKKSDEVLRKYGKRLTAWRMRDVTWNKVGKEWFIKNEED